MSIEIEEELLPVAACEHEPTVRATQNGTTKFTASCHRCGVTGAPKFSIDLALDDFWTEVVAQGGSLPTTSSASRIFGAALTGVFIALMVFAAVLVLS